MAISRKILNINELKKQKEFFKIILAITIFKTGLSMRRRREVNF